MGTRHVTETSLKWKDPHPEGISKHYVPPGRYTRDEILAIVRTAWRESGRKPKWDELDSDRKCTYFDQAVEICNNSLATSAWETLVLEMRDKWDEQKGQKDG